MKSELAVTERLENICRIVQNFLFCLVTASSPPSGDWRPGVH
jgi:hypothetical protein